MARYRKKPIEVEARLLDSLDYDGACDIVAWCGGRAVDEGVEIETSEGVMLAAFGDYVIAEPFPSGDRTFYPCKPSIFEATYERVQS